MYDTTRHDAMERGKRVQLLYSEHFYYLNNFQTRYIFHTHPFYAHTQFARKKENPFGFSRIKVLFENK